MLKPSFVFLIKDRNSEKAIGYLAEDVFKQSVKEVVWFLLTTYSKIQEEKDELKMEWLSKMEPELKYLKNSKAAHVAKSEEPCLEENRKNRAD